VKSILFIGGSLNQTSQMHRIAEQLGEHRAAFSPYYCDPPLDWARRAGLLEFSTLGEKLRRRCLDYLTAHGLTIDVGGRRGPYDLVLTSSDLVVPRNIRRGPVVLVQEGILDPDSFGLRLWRRAPFLPLWIGGTSTTGLSHAYDRFCVASEGYRDLFVRNGAPRERVVVTGIPNFDDCRRYYENDFPHRDFVLVCTSDTRETFKPDNRTAFIRRCLEVAAGRLLIFKLHPNENARRATAEINRLAPQALVYAKGSAEEMIANCSVLITQWSSTVFVGLALGKEVHSFHDLAEVRRLVPDQHGEAARRIAGVCRELLAA
jgi:hypothetical protein